MALDDTVTPEDTKKISPGFVSEKDAQIASIIAHQDPFPDVSVVDKHHDLFELPKEAKAKLDRYDFRWVSKDTRMMDRNMIKGWRFVNRTNCPWMPEHWFSVNGGVEKFGHVLGFRPKDLSAAYRKKYSVQSQNNIDSAFKKGEKDKDGSPFYSAKIDAKENETEGGPGELVEGKDF